MFFQEPYRGMRKPKQRKIVLPFGRCSISVKRDLGRKECHYEAMLASLAGSKKKRLNRSGDSVWQRKLPNQHGTPSGAAWNARFTLWATGDLVCYKTKGIVRGL